MSYSSQLAQARFQSYLRAQNVLSDDKTPSDNAHDKDHLDEPIEHGRFQQPTGYLDTHAVEQSSMDKHLSENNIGYKLMLKMGWSKGKGLGRDGEGRVDPVRIVDNYQGSTLGVGKGEELDTYHAESTAKRKALESEKIAEETEEERRAREAKLQRAEAIKEEIKTVTSAFYCDVCNKQYNKIAEYETHLSSYDHHHRKRFKEMQEMSKKGILPGTAKRKRQDKERAREEKELLRLQEAALARDRSRIKDDSGVSSPQRSNEGAGNSSTTASDETKGGWAEASETPSKGGWSSLDNNASDTGKKGEWATIQDPGLLADCIPISDDEDERMETSRGGWTSSTTSEPTGGFSSLSTPQESKPSGAPPTKLAFGFGTKKVGSGLKFSFGKKS